MIKNFLNFKIFFGAAVFGAGVFALVIWFLWSAKANPNSLIPATAILKEIDAPTQTPLGRSSTTTPTLSPTTVHQTPTPSGDITVGSYVQVIGTGGDGLRLHNDAAVASKVNYVAIEAEEFLVKGGPINADGYIWWELENPYTKNAVGWGVANYLSVVSNP